MGGRGKEDFKDFKPINLAWGLYKLLVVQY